MDPVTVLSALAGAAKGLYEIAGKVRENREQCVRLCVHVNAVLDIVRQECADGVPPRVLKRMAKLTSALSDLIVTLEGLHKSSFLQRVVWRDQIASKIQDLYKDIFEAVQDLKLGLAFDICKVQQENEDARREDAATAKENFDRLLSNDKEILGELEIHKQQMQEAIVCLHRYLGQLPDSVERRYLENGMHALQRRSGPLRIPPDVFVITSLDVIVHYDKKLGQGGFTSVYEAHWRGTKVAVKVMDRGVPASAIEREVDVWRRLRHPHILEFFGACSIADPPFMVCAYKQNGDAVDYLRRFPEANRLQLLYEAALGLAYLHSNGVVHGDIKASNILIDEHGKACLSDFGLSQIKIHTTSIRWGPGTSPSHGTARWMSPEHMTEGITNKRTDVYSFGMTMFEVFTGNPPFAATPETVLLAVICDRGVRPSRPEDPAVERHGLNDEVWGLMTRTWAHQPERRPLAPDILSMLTRHAALVPPQDAYTASPWPRSAGPSSALEPRIPAKTSPGHTRSATVASTSSGGSHASSLSSAQSTQLRGTTSFSPTPSMQSLSTVSSRTSFGTLSKSSVGGTAGPRAASSTLPKPYVSAGARELIDFLDEGPPADGEEEEEEATSSKAPPPRRSLGLARLPTRIVRIAKRRDSSDATSKARKSSTASVPERDAAARPPVSDSDVRVLIDFLDEGPPEDADADADAGPASPSRAPFFSRHARRTRTKGPAATSDDARRAPDRREPPASPPRTGSASARSQPYISAGARELVAFLDEGPPEAVRQQRRRGRQGSAASSEAESPSSARRIRDMFMRGRAAVQPAAPSPAASRRPSCASLAADPFLPLPIASCASSMAGSASQDDASAVDDAHSPPAGDPEQGLRTTHALGEPGPQQAPEGGGPQLALALAESTSAGAAVVVLSTLVLYMLLFSPIA